MALSATDGHPYEAELDNYLSLSFTRKKGGKNPKQMLAGGSKQRWPLLWCFRCLAVARASAVSGRLFASPGFTFPALLLAISQAGVSI